LSEEKIIEETKQDLNFVDQEIDLKTEEEEIPVIMEQNYDDI